MLPFTPYPSTGAWLGVVANRDGFERLSNEKETWWCVPTVTKPNDLLFMYCAKALSLANQGVFALFQITKIDDGYDSECARYGSTSGFGRPVFANITLVNRRSTPLRPTTMRADPILARAKFMTRNFQGTIFQLQRIELARIKTHFDLDETSSKKKLTRKIK